MAENQECGPANLLKIATALLDGEDIDWGQAVTATPRSQRDLLENLRAIARVTAAHKSEPWLPPHNWGPLEIGEKIGEGAFGEVFRAREPRLDRLVALKFFRPHRLSPLPLSSDVIEEGRLLARVRHPNVVTVYGAESLGGRVGIWMEFIAGSTLEDILAESGPLSAADAMAIGRDLCQALAALHAAGVIHRDIKARNVMRENGGRIVLMDLGVSCEIDHQVPIKEYGTPLYAAPEVLRANVASFQTDIYSVGVFLFYLVTGQYPVAAATLAEITSAHEAGRYRTLRELKPELGEAFINIVDKALARDPTGRFASAVDFERALTETLDDGARTRGARARAATRPVDADGLDTTRQADLTGQQAKVTTTDQQAYNRFLQGRHFWNRRFRGELPRAIECFRQAIARDPNFALAHVGIADCLNQLSFFQYLRPRDGFVEARASAERALELDADLGEAYAALAWISMCFDWDFATAEQQFLRATRLNPQYAMARQWYALLLSVTGKHDEALDEVRKGRELDPTALISASEAVVLAHADRREEAIHAYRISLETDPESLNHNMNLGSTLWMSGAIEEGEALLRKAVALSQGKDSYAVSLLAAGLALSGREDESLAVIAQLDALAETRYVSFWHRAMPWLLLDRYDKWGPLLDKAIEERDPFLIAIRPTSVWDPWRADPRFAEPLRQVGLLD